MSKQGYLKKKSSVAILGRHTWNKRFLVILPHSNEVAVYDSHETVTKQLDSLPFDQITSVQILPKKKRRRFNVTLQGSEVVALLAETPEEAAEWVAAISDAHETFRAEAAAAKRKASEERRAAEAKEREDEANEVVVVVDVDGDDASEAPAADADAEEGPALAGHLVRMNSAAAVRSVSAVSFMSQASAVSEETFQSMRRMYFVLRNGTLTFYTNESREVPLGFVEAANIEAVKAYKVEGGAAEEENAGDDAEANKAEGVRVYLGEEHELWELAVPESEATDAAAWVEALDTAREAAQTERASDAAAAKASGDGAAAAEEEAAEEEAATKTEATTEEYQDVDLEAEKKGKAGEKPKEQENDIKEKKKGGGCHCIVM